MTSKLTEEQKQIVDNIKKEIKNLDDLQRKKFNDLCATIKIEDDAIAKQYLWDYIFNNFKTLHL